MNTTDSNHNRRPDELDKAIIRLLHIDGRMSYSEIGRRTGVSEVTARKRVERLISEGSLAIVGISNPFHLGFRTQVWIGLNVELSMLNEVAEQLATMPEFSYVACSAGEYDILATAAFESDAALYDFLATKLGKVEGVRGTHTSHLIKLMRRTFAFRSVDTTFENTPVEVRPVLMPHDPSNEVDNPVEIPPGDESIVE